MTDRKSAGSFWLVYAIALFIVLFAVTASCFAQENWVRCKYAIDGTEQSFPGTQCPASWYPI